MFKQIYATFIHSFNQYFWTQLKSIIYFGILRSAQLLPVENVSIPAIHHVNIALLWSLTNIIMKINVNNHRVISYFVIKLARSAENLQQILLKIEINWSLIINWKYICSIETESSGPPPPVVKLNVEKKFRRKYFLYMSGRTPPVVCEPFQGTGNVWRV